MAAIASTTRDPRKVCVYLDPEMQAELQREARRLDCSISHLMQRAWRIARRRFAEQSAPTPTIDQPVPLTSTASSSSSDSTGSSPLGRRAASGRRSS